jgi:hypothetical protein
MVTPDQTMVDLGCGRGGPGLWLASRAGAHLIGIDASAAVPGPGGCAVSGGRCGHHGTTGWLRRRAGCPRRAAAASSTNRDADRGDPAIATPAREHGKASVTPRLASLATCPKSSSVRGCAWTAAPKARLLATPAAHLPARSPARCGSAWRSRDLRARRRGAPLAGRAPRSECPQRLRATTDTTRRQMPVRSDRASLVSG